MGAMDGPLPHERPAYLLLARGADLGAALAHALAHPEVRVAALPPLWFLDAAGIDLVAALGDLRQFDTQALPRVLATVGRLCTREALIALAERTWREVGEQVRQHYLKRGTLKTFASIFGLGAKSRNVGPPEEFVAEQVRIQRLEIQYRLAPQPMEPPPPAPAEEGSLIVYPFDLEGALARRELGLAQDGGPVIELFAYAWQHERHAAFWSRLAADLGGALRA